VQPSGPLFGPRACAQVPSDSAAVRGGANPVVRPVHRKIRYGRERMWLEVVLSISFCKAAADAVLGPRRQGCGLGGGFGVGRGGGPVENRAVCGFPWGRLRFPCRIRAQSMPRFAADQVVKASKWAYREQPVWGAVSGQNRTISILETVQEAFWRRRAERTRQRWDQVAA